MFQGSSKISKFDRELRRKFDGIELTNETPESRFQNMLDEAEDMIRITGT